MFKTTFICPYCFEKHMLSEVQFGRANKHYKYFNKGMFIKRKNSIQMCNGVCPSCKNILPQSTLMGKNLIISILGNIQMRRQYLSILVKKLNEGFMEEFDLKLNKIYVNPQWEENLNDYDVNNFGDEQLLAFELNMINRSGNIVKSYTLSFYDFGSGGMTTMEKVNLWDRFICNSTGIIFLLDPMQIPAVVNQLDESTVKRAVAIDYRSVEKADDIMTRASNLIRNDRKMSYAAKIDIPVAAVFSRLDAIEPIVPYDCTVLNPSPHCSEKHFDMSDWHNVNSEIQALLHEWDADAFISQLETNYSNYSYFAASALGLNNNPDQSGKIERPRPHRIEDPFLWILKENGVIKGK